MANTTIFSAKKILTMNPRQPVATHVAVREGRILGVGTLDDLKGWGEYHLDNRFDQKVLMPGMVEGHSHIQEGGIWNFAYIGFYDRRGPDGRLWKGLKSFDAVAERLCAAEQELHDPQQALLAWGFDPIFIEGPRLSAADLDRVSPSRPIAVLHTSGIVMTVNSSMLKAAGISAASAVDGIARDAEGNPTGELQTFAAMFMVFRIIGNAFFAAAHEKAGIWNFGRVAQLAGVTTAADLLTEITPLNLANLTAVTSDQDFPIRIVPAVGARYQSPEEGVALIKKLEKMNTDKLRFGAVKVAVDGSIQGFTARLRWPGYFNGKPNGLWMVAPQQLTQILSVYHKAGVQAHIHTNGDEATDVTLDSLDKILTEHPWRDHRHTLQHCQMADAFQFQRMARLGVCANLFINHVYYWGDAHYSTTIGPDRARRMDAAGTAQSSGVHYALHSDAPISPIGPLFSAWCAINRKTASGRVLGEAERISISDALHAVTLGAAYTLKLEHEIGSIEVGKRADFAVLEQDPTLVPPDDLRDIPVWGTVLGGTVFAAPQL
ncbi:amidohydrolase [Noviherbaspirillum soli]|uniref:amidohydrolase n=1 Tax=Noviherbaspirillum soli TaxID=1064518 RepID=UPI00188B424F|nr:amidohydrolase [Noviherbaspirillum soli]